MYVILQDSDVIALATDLDNTWRLLDEYFGESVKEKMSNFRDVRDSQIEFDFEWEEEYRYGLLKSKITVLEFIPNEL